MFEPGTKFLESKKSVLLVDGLRTPFMRSGSEFVDQISYDLAREVLKGILLRNGLSGNDLDSVIMGSVVQNSSTPNVARDAALGAGIPNTVPASTVTMACISASKAISEGMNAIWLGQADTVLAGGVEVLSDVPVGFKKEVRKKFFESRKYKGPLDYTNFLKGISPGDLLPIAPAIAEFSTQETMGESADKLAASFGISRQAQDEYALRSHHLAAKASVEGKLSNEIMPTAVAPGFTPFSQDNTFRADTSLEALAKLKPVFVKPFGTVTAGNSSPLTDGAAVSLLMSEDKAKAMGYSPKAYLRDYVFVAQDPAEELLLGPAYATPKLLERNGLGFSDLDVIEIHEAFAGQVLAVLAALESDKFAQEQLGRKEKVASINLDKINLWGGSLSLGHPFGATGSRLVNQAANRLHDEDGRFALVTACAAGGLGHAMLIERAS
ncbi:MAG: acetyl-CoA C-acyltransferase [Trueperaceae bacterium]|nr:acetyl-CoA C-acyltransferase [Trueperaceae bacterium]